MTVVDTPENPLTPDILDYRVDKADTVALLSSQYEEGLRQEALRLTATLGEARKALKESEEALSALAYSKVPGDVTARFEAALEPIRAITDSPKGVYLERTFSETRVRLSITRDGYSSYYNLYQNVEVDDDEIKAGREHVESAANLVKKTLASLEEAESKLRPQHIQAYERQARTMLTKAVLGKSEQGRKLVTLLGSVNRSTQRALEGR